MFQLIDILLRYFNFEPSFKLRWYRARDLFASQIPVTTGGGGREGFQLQISCMQCSYLTYEAIKPNRLGRFRVQEFVELDQE